MHAKEIILRNFPHNGLYDDSSFLGKLHEEKLWDIEEYWLLEWGIYNLEKSASEKLDWEVFRIFSSIMLSISSHLDKNDYFKIKNLKRPKLYELRERVQLVFEGYFSQTMPEQNIFEEVNPLLISPI
ncbi:MAG: hypothetical protein KBT36_02745 [Kurthia sp.]|uniref:Imm41 family immunity protein n=1 Tax=Acinetobacter lanii TaxID=2715163 RepID=UPI00140778AD|nr:Imm41 family immunity protein [Acinetobacter lanii]MBQ0138191.1 hypothetical protein [Candidatus Kurthia equi]NHC05045.1 hypothetical protein [Acinetobacter lanii]